jgi:cytochrome oxidase assembly protein ShyY1
MDPKLIDILLHYYNNIAPHIDTQKGREVLVEKGFLNLHEGSSWSDRITEKGHAYIEALLAVPEEGEQWFFIPDLRRAREQQQSGLKVEVVNPLPDVKYDIRSDQQYGIDQKAQHAADNPKNLDRGMK